MYKTIVPAEINQNVFKLIANDWMLLSAGNITNFNNMTASWGGLGYLWNKPVAFIFVRPTRHSYSFIENNDYFTINFFEEKYREILKLSGTKSGREIDKMNGLGLTAIENENKSVYYSEANMVLECKKKFFQDIEPANFIDNTIINNYPKSDFHRMYVGEIIKVLVKR